MGWAANSHRHDPASPAFQRDRQACPAAFVRLGPIRGHAHCGCARNRWIAAGAGRTTGPLAGASACWTVTARADDRIERQPNRVVDILLSGRTTELRFAGQLIKPMDYTLSCKDVAQCRQRLIGQLNRLIQLMQLQKAAVRSELLSLESQPHVSAQCTQFHSVPPLPLWVTHETRAPQSSTP
jgi:hypothetical protein